MVSSKIIKTVRQAPVINGDLPSEYRAVHNEIVDLLQESRRQAARNVNVLMTARYCRHCLQYPAIPILWRKLLRSFP
jgi:hypothetical protein